MYTGRIVHTRILSAFFGLALLPAALASGGGAGESSSGLALVGATVIDGTGAPPIPNGVVLVSGNRVERVGRTGAFLIPSSYRRYFLAGTTVLPGFINAHVHQAYNLVHLRGWLRSGITSVRDLGPVAAGDFLSLRDSLDRDPQCARLIAATPLITAPGGYGSLFVDSPGEAEAAVRGLIDEGVDVIKIALEDDLQGRTWPMLSATIAKRIVATVHSRGVRVSAHISHTRNLSIALEAGVDDLAHMVVEPLDDRQIRAIVKKGIAWTPTLELWKGVSEMHGLDWGRIAIDNLARFYRAGGIIALGTDYAGYSCNFDDGFPITEVGLMASAGMTSMDIILAGTRNAAIVSGRGKDLGTLAPGKIADLLVVEGDPLADLRALADTAMVVHNGRVVPIGM